MYHIPSKNLIGAHVIRYSDGRVAICTSHDSDSRRAAVRMMSAAERVQLMSQMGGAWAVDAWLAQEQVRPRDVPQSLRALHYNYEHDYWPVPVPEFAELYEAYPEVGPKVAPPPLSIEQLA